MTTRPLPDEAFVATAQTHRYDVAERPADAVAVMLADFAPRIAMALGVSDLQAVEGSQVEGGDPVDHALVTTGLDLRTRIAPQRSGDLTLFIIHGRHVAGLEERGRHERLLVQRGGVTVCEFVVCTSQRRRYEAKGREAKDPEAKGPEAKSHDAKDLELDQAHVRITHGLDTMLGGVLSELVAALRVRPPVVLAPDADLDGVSLGGGSPNGGGTERAVVDWVLQPTAIVAVRELFGEYIERCFAQFGLGSVPTLETSTTRTASDVHEESFSMLTRSAATTTVPRVRLVLSTVESFRSPGDVDHVSVNLDMRTNTDRLRIVSTGRSGATCTQLRLHRPTSKEAIEALWETFAAILDPAR